MNVFKNNFDLLVKNIAINGYQNITPVPKAISNKNGKTKLFLNTFIWGAHTLARPGLLRVKNLTTLRKILNSIHPPAT